MPPYGAPPSQFDFKRFTISKSDTREILRSRSSQCERRSLVTSGGFSQSFGDRASRESAILSDQTAMVDDGDKQEEDEAIASLTPPRAACATHSRKSALTDERRSMTTSFNLAESDLQAESRMTAGNIRASASSNRSSCYEVSTDIKSLLGPRKSTVMSQRPKFPFGAWSTSTPSEHRSEAALDPKGRVRCTHGIVPSPEIDLPRTRVFDHSTSYQRPPSPGSLRREQHSKMKFRFFNFGLKPAAFAFHGKLLPCVQKGGEGVKVFPNAPMMQSDVDKVVFGRDLDLSGDTQFDPEFTVMYDGMRGYPSWVSRPPRSKKLYANSPMQQSTVDQVVFGRDMDYSGETKFDREFTQMFDGHAGLPSWHKAD